MKNTILVFLLCSLLAPATHGSARNPESEKDTYTNPVRTTDGEVLQVADPFVYEYKGSHIIMIPEPRPEICGFGLLYLERPRDVGIRGAAVSQIGRAFRRRGILGSGGKVL